MRGSAVLIAAAMAIMGLAGCTSSPSGATATVATLSRIVVANIDEDALAVLASEEDPMAGAAKLLETEFVYTHQGEATDPDDLSVRFTDETGHQTDAPLADYTSKAKLGKGDRVTIDGVFVGSGMEVRDGSTVVASRGQPGTKWLEVSNVPIPLASQGSGKVVYDVKMDGELGLAFKHVAVTEEDEGYCYTDWTPDGPEETCTEDEQTTTTVDGFSFDGSAHLGGTIRLEATPTGSGTHLELGADTTFSVEADMGAKVKEGSDPAVDFGFEFDYSGSAKGEVWGDADGDGDLTKWGASGSFKGDGSAYIWDDEHPESEHYKVPEVGPMDFSGDFDDEIPRTMFPMLGLGFIEDLYAMDLAPGDKFTFDAEVEGFGVHFETSVVARETRTIGGLEVPALRITNDIEVALPVGDPIRMASTSWVHATSHILLKSSSEFVKSLDQDEIGPMVALFEQMGELDIDGPTEPRITVNLKSSIKAVEYEDGLQLSGALPVMGAMAPLAVFSSGLFYGMMSGMGGEGSYEDDMYYEE